MGPWDEARTRVRQKLGDSYGRLSDYRAEQRELRRQGLPTDEEQHRREVAAANARLDVIFALRGGWCDMGHGAGI